MDPSEYVDAYLRFFAWMSDGFTAVRVRNYLQSGLGDQAARAKVAYGKFSSALAARLKRRGALPGVFDALGDKFLASSLWRVFNGKGAPDEIQDALLLASWCGLIDSSTVNDYADRNLGVDCGGFVANYWGIGRPSLGDLNPIGATGFKPRTIWEMNKALRRDHPSKIYPGDAAVFFEDVKGNDPDVVAKKKADGKYDVTSGSQAFHIGVVSDVSWQGGTSTISLEIAESSGARAKSGGNGVNVRSLGQVETTVAKNLVYCRDGNNRVYFVACNGQPNPYMPWYSNPPRSLFC